MNDTFNILIVDAQTGESNERPLTSDEIADLNQQQIEAEVREAEQHAKATARSNALAKLAELGLTQEEIDAL
jgi:hypothetical protein